MLRLPVFEVPGFSLSLKTACGTQVSFRPAFLSASEVRWACYTVHCWQAGAGQGPGQGCRPRGQGADQTGRTQLLCKGRHFPIF
jgi:hypothetical protein